MSETNKMAQNKTKHLTDGYGGTAAYGNKGYAYLVNDRTLLPFFLILFLISPVLALISAMFNFRKRGAHLVMYLFMAALGYTFIVNPGMDAERVTGRFVEYFQYMSLSEFVNDLYAMMMLRTTESHYPEPYMTVLSYTLAQFTADRNIFMMVIGLIFGIAYIKGISLVYEEREGSWDLVTLLLFIFFISFIHVVGINAPRNFTGACVFFAGAYLYIKNQEYKYLLIVLLAPMIHFAYLVIVMPFFVYVVLKDQKYLYITVLAVSLVASTGLSVLEPVLTSTELGQDKVEIYTGDRYDPDAAPSSFEQSRSFHAKYYTMAGRWAIFVMFFSAVFFMGYFSGSYHDRLQTGLGSVAILTLALANFTEVIPALSGRTRALFALFALAYLIRLFSREAVRDKAYHWIVYFSTPAILFFIFTMSSRAGDYIDFKVLVSPLLYPFLGDDPVSLKEFLRTILGL